MNWLVTDEKMLRLLHLILENPDDITHVNDDNWRTNPNNKMSFSFRGARLCTEQRFIAPSLMPSHLNNCFTAFTLTLYASDHDDYVKYIFLSSLAVLFIKVDEDLRIKPFRDLHEIVAGKIIGPERLLDKLLAQPT